MAKKFKASDGSKHKSPSGVSQHEIFLRSKAGKEFTRINAENAAKAAATALARKKDVDGVALKSADAGRQKDRDGRQALVEDFFGVRKPRKKVGDADELLG